MSKICEIQIGKILTNSEIVKIFKCSNMGGMRRSRETNSLVIISDHTKGLYDDKWYGDTLHYTGMGKNGDQNINFGQNKTLVQSHNNGINIYLFEVLIPTKYIYHGRVFLGDEPYQENQIGDDGNLRKVWMFPLKLEESIGIVAEEIFQKNLNEKEKLVSKLSLEELEKKVKLYENDKISNRKIQSNVVVRDPYITEYVIKKSDGVCQLCENKAPFSKKDGSPYLECYHIEPFSSGGSEKIENTVALCPNCHKKMQILNLNSDKEKLLKAIKKEV